MSTPSTGLLTPSKDLRQFVKLANKAKDAKKLSPKLKAEFKKAGFANVGLVKDSKGELSVILDTNNDGVFDTSAKSRDLKAKDVDAFIKCLDIALVSGSINKEEKKCLDTFAVDYIVQKSEGTTLVTVDFEKNGVIDYDKEKVYQISPDSYWKSERTSTKKAAKKAASLKSDSLKKKD